MDWEQIGRDLRDERCAAHAAMEEWYREYSERCAIERSLRGPAELAWVAAIDKHFNHVTLKRWIDQEGFPLGIMLGPNTRAWRRSWIEEWLANRPTENTAKRQRGGRS